jgi:hypothetical protein
MTILLDAEFPRTLDALVARFTASPVARLEAWLFEDEAARRAAEKRLLAAGIQARLRSAYKPLLHFFLEEATPQGDITIALPTRDAAMRWRLEAYPLAGLFAAARFTFTEGPHPLDHIVTIAGDTHRVFAPNRTRTDHLGQTTLNPGGWLRTWDAAGNPIEDIPLETELEALFAAGMNAVLSHDWPETPPFFRTLSLDADLPGIERLLPYHDEVLSTREALHEDFYFSILEALKHRAGLPAADRTLQPGQIVPDIRALEGPARLRVTLSDQPPGEYILTGPATLETADRPLAPPQIARELETIGGTPLLFHSVQGRPIQGRIIDGTAPAIVITGAQHANETSGVIGALRAAHRLKAEAAGCFAVIPCDNPDGYALHHRLRAANPRHMHHAARYTALGDDLESRDAPPFFERQARLDTIAQTGARLHINLHGYPAHEWTRPLSGYLPRGFELWTIPKGFFLILRHAPGLAAQAETFTKALAEDLASDPALRAHNESQLATWNAHAGAPTFTVHHAIPCMISENTRPGPDFTLITEYPDETIYDAPFRLAHTTQMRATLAAVRLFRALCV